MHKDPLGEPDGARTVQGGIDRKRTGVRIGDIAERTLFVVVEG